MTQKLITATPAFPVRKAQDGEQMYRTTVVTSLQPAEFGSWAGEANLNFSADGLFQHTTQNFQAGDCGIKIRSGDPWLGCHVWMHWMTAGDDGYPKYNRNSFPVTPDQLITLGQALVAMGMNDKARAEMTRNDRINTAVDSIWTYAIKENLDKEETVELRKEVQRRLTEQVRVR